MNPILQQCRDEANRHCTRGDCRGLDHHGGLWEFKFLNGQRLPLVLNDLSGSGIRELQWRLCVHCCVDNRGHRLEFKRVLQHAQERRRQSRCIEGSDR